MPNEKKMKGIKTWQTNKTKQEKKQIWIYSAMAKILDDGVLIIMGGMYVEYKRLFWLNDNFFFDCFWIKLMNILIGKIPWF